ncbi:uncharacterized protein LOC119192448 [Manduca sexta]|uniref:uncharacterized protein LOC119192448 n=1 Tax=Manduca sexta TaxID=7130 RepID=UPI00188E8A08|nr:uncharacterized protein LOC119192448 [Manduca sexta]
MCWANKVCFFIPLNSAGVVIGVGNIIFSTIVTIATMTMILIQEYTVHHDEQHILQHLFKTDMTKSVIEIIIIIALLIGTLGIPFSICLLVGVRKNIPSLVLSYFVYGIIVTIICILAALLEVVHNFWIIAAVKILLVLINIHILVVVHTIYELMSRGKIFGSNNHSLLDEEGLWDSNMDK